MPFTFTKTELPGVTIVDPRVVEDHRGFFMETYKHSAFAAAGIDAAFVQDNHSRSVRGTLRGLHLQHEPKGQAKLVRVLEGEVFDVAADIRPDSPTYGRWVSVILTGENRRAVFIPAGYAHGFCVITEAAQILYKATDEYAPELEGGARWDDPLLSIPWPIANPLLSERDRRWPLLPPRGAR